MRQTQLTLVELLTTPLKHWKSSVTTTYQPRKTLVRSSHKKQRWIENDQKIKKMNQKKKKNFKFPCTSGTQHNAQILPRSFILKMSFIGIKSHCQTPILLIANVNRLNIVGTRTSYRYRRDIDNKNYRWNTNIPRKNIPEFKNDQKLKSAMITSGLRNWGKKK